VITKDAHAIRRHDRLRIDLVSPPFLGTLAHP
jgi:hypothetical protein